MLNKPLTAPLCAGFLTMISLASQPAFAVSSFETNAARDTDSGVASDPRGPATTGSLLSEVTTFDGSSLDFAGDAFARGAADDTGAGAVGLEGIFFSGGTTLSELTAVSTLTTDITNNTGGVAPYAYDFFLPGPRLTIADFAGLSATSSPTIRAFFDFRVSVDLGSGFVPVVVSQGELQGGLVEHTLGTDGTAPLGSTFFDSGSVFGYQFDSLDSSITGQVADGQTVAVQTDLFVSLTAPGFETGGAAAIGDPLDLSSGAFTGSLTLVPVPAALWLFGSGLVGVLGFVRKAKAVSAIG